MKHSFSLCRLAMVLGAQGAFIFESSALPAQEPRIIAYEVPAGTVGDQDVGGIALGLDFDLNLDILITRLGVFDSGSDGLATPLTAKLYDRDDPSVELGAVEFTPEDPGELVGGSRFKEFEIDLPAGFHGSIVASGYNALELNGNSDGDITNPFGLSLNDGGCAILFTGGGRFGNDEFSYPATPDGGPPNRYAAGTFEYTPEGAFPAFHDGIAYVVPAGTVGNQDANVALGLDFDVNTRLQVTRLGVFDSGSDGLLAPLTARIFNRVTGGELAHIDFTAEDPGELVDGSRFKDLVPPLCLDKGFTGTIVGEGYNVDELNGNQGLGPIDGLTLDNGGCALSFRGGGRAGPLGGFPEAGDGGPPNRYAAGTFEFKIDTTGVCTPRPCTPANLLAKSGDGKIDLSWDACGGVPPAAKYRVFRAPSAGGVFAQIAETASTQYTDSPLPNEMLVCYLVRAVSAAGDESFDSAKVCELPAGPQPEGRFVAYKVPGGTNGNQDAGNGLGMDFDITADITVLRLGVFDDGSNGLSLPIAARIFDRDTMTEMALLEFLPDDPGILIGGSRFKPLDSPLDLLEGFHGTMVASGYGGAERNGNLGLGPLDLSTDDGGCRISFVGASRFGADPIGFPATVDGGPANRYAAGTFEFVALGKPIDPTPQPPLDVIAGIEGSAILVSWTPAPLSGCTPPTSSFKVFRSVSGGPYTFLAEVVDALYLDSTVADGVDYCYKVHTLGGGLESGDSPAGCATPGRYIAYVVPSGTAGTLTDVPAVGMDFDVNLDVQVTRLGAFDSLGDGLQSTIIVTLYNRETEEVLASEEFTPADAGALFNGSRFKAISPPLNLAAGLKCAIVAEGYNIDEPAGTGAGPWFTSPGPCSLSFTGVGRSLPGVGALPESNAAGRTDQYAAGTFEFKPTQFGTPHGAIAYNVPAGTAGNQAFGGTLGNDFNVNVPIRVTRLGVFDSGSDGLSRPLTARIYNRDSRSVVAELKFSAADPGELVEGSRFKTLDPPLSLAAGFHGVMVGAGYGATEQNGNSLSAAAGVPWTVDDGGCAITFVGLGRFGGLPALYPNNVDGGPAYRYAAGTFEFEIEGGEPKKTFHRGDADNNGQLQLTDAVRILGYLFLGQVPPTCFDAADADDNGQLQLTDAVRILGYLFLGQAPPAPPGPPDGVTACGSDPTEDDTLDCAEYTNC